MQIAQTMKRHPRGTILVAAVLVAIGAFALYWFAPWNLFVDRRVDEAAPGVTAPVAEPEEEVAAEEPVGTGAAAGAGESSGAGAAQDADGGAAEESGGGQAAGPVTLTTGGFSGLEHETAGTALVVQLEDGSRFLRLEDLETSNGPDLRVIITDQAVSDDWHVWDDGAYVDLGALKGNIGSSNYELPRSVDLDDFRTAVIWCRRFSVGFGVAPLEPAA